MGHSLGGPTIRYAAHMRPDLVASVTTINAVNFGSDVADVAFEIVPVDGGAAAFIDEALSLMGDITDSLAGNPEYANNALDAALFMTSERSSEFNAFAPEGKPTSTCGEGAPSVVIKKNGVNHTVRYYSWGGDAAFTNCLLYTSPSPRD